MSDTDLNDPAMQQLRHAVRQHDVIELHHRGKTTRFYDQKGSLAACHRGGWFYESAMLDHIADLGLRGVYLDVGANIGNHTVYFAQHCPSVMVHAFEPIDFIRAHLHENSALNELQNVRIHPYGLGDSVGTFSTQQAHRQFSIECRLLDEQDLDLSGLVLLKVDIEGMEAAFLRGARKTLSRFRPRIYIEAHTESSLKSIRDELDLHGYLPTSKVFNKWSPTYEFAASAS